MCFYINKVKAASGHFFLASFFLLDAVIVKYNIIYIYCKTEKMLMKIHIKNYIEIILKKSLFFLHVGTQ